MKILNINSAHLCASSLKHPKTHFVGHLGTEELALTDVFETQRKTLIQETAFFRGPETLEFVRDYVNKTFADKNKVNIVVGGCSSGEEAWTLKMLFGDRADVSGFDLGEVAVEKAKSGNYTISKPPNRIYDKYYETHRDRYLALKRPATEQEVEYKRLFAEYFEPANSKTDEQPASFFKKLTPLSSNKTKNFKVKDNKAGDCKFAQGDILKLDEFLEPNSVNVLTFRNALYHLTTTRTEMGVHLSRPNKEIESMLDDLFGKIRKVLTKDGIFVLGTHTNDHLESYPKDGSGTGELIYRLLEKNGFEPAFVEDEKASVWRKVA